MTSALFLSSATTRTTGVSRSPLLDAPRGARLARLSARVGAARRPAAPVPDAAASPEPASGNGWGCAPAAADAPPKAVVLGRACEDAPPPIPAPSPPPARAPRATVVEPGAVCTVRPPPPEDSTSFRTAARSVALLFWT